MDKELIKDLKLYDFICTETNNITNYRKCLKTCNNESCWKNHLKSHLRTKNEAENENNVENYIYCPNCDSDEIVSIGGNNYLCTTCGKITTLSNENIKTILEANHKYVDNEEIDKVIDNELNSFGT